LLFLQCTRLLHVRNSNQQRNNSLLSQDRTARSTTTIPYLAGKNDSHSPNDNRVLIPDVLIRRMRYIC
ncbi:MAG: hypothetical protein K1X91_16330, partial [Bacteriodetes bacterium]|nr:hypothetical protein [Bacteroidota bacterium]